MILWCDTHNRQARLDWLTHTAMCNQSGIETRSNDTAPCNTRTVDEDRIEQSDLMEHH